MSFQSARVEVISEEYDRELNRHIIYSETIWNVPDESVTKRCNFFTIV